LVPVKAVSERRDYYEVLGVGRDVDAAELKRAYRKLAMELHPDRNPGDREAEESFKAASEAYQVLSDPEKRAYYDRFGHAGPGAGMGGFHDVHDIFSSFSDILGDLFGGQTGGGGRRSGPARGADIETRMVITLKEAFTGVTKSTKVLRRTACGTCKGTGAAPGTSPESCERCGGRGQVMHSQGFLMISSACPTCRGEGRVIRKPCRTCEGSGMDHEEETLEVAIPAGVEDGSTLRITGRGESGPQGGRAGNLYVILRVQPDERFERDGADLHTEIAVSFPQLALGDRVTVATVDGETVLDIPAGSQASQTIALSERGMPYVDRAGKGDLIVHLRLVVPTSLSDAEAAHLRAYADAGGRRVDPDRAGVSRSNKKKK
jgi:molecular chaperone DnaJ